MSSWVRCVCEESAIWNKCFVFLARNNGKTRLHRFVSKASSFADSSLALDAHECEKMVEMTVRLCQEDLLVVISTVIAARILKDQASQHTL